MFHDETSPQPCLSMSASVASGSRSLRVCLPNGCQKRQRTAAPQKLAHLPTRRSCAKRRGVRQSSAAFRLKLSLSAARPLHAALLLPLLLFIGGCRTAPTPKLVMTGDVMVDGPNAIANGPPRDRVLWEYRTASAALRQGNFDVAKQYLDEALTSLQNIYGKDEEARKSRGYFEREARKTFLGEPYERSMAYIYRGMIYWRDGQVDNARACFRSAQFEDSDTQEKKYAGDWVLPDYLEGLANLKLGGDSVEPLKRAQANARGITLPPYNPNADTLFFIEFGRGPTKYASGQYGEELRFRVTNSPGAAAELKVDAMTFPVAPTDDVGYQATTRGGRVMDHVLNSKAQFKSATSTAGDVALITGGVLAVGGQGRHNATSEVGLGLMLAGLASKIISSATTPEADIRAWDTLPNSVSVAMLRLAPGKHTAVVQFRNDGGLGPAMFAKTINFTVEPGHEKVIFVSDQSTTPQEQ